MLPRGLTQRYDFSNQKCWSYSGAKFHSALWKQVTPYLELCYPSKDPTLGTYSRSGETLEIS